MDWDTLHRTTYSRSVEKLAFNPRQAKSYFIECPPAETGVAAASFLAEDLPNEASMRVWLAEQRTKSNSGSGWPNWSLTVLALQRGPPNEFERKDQGAGDQLLDVGCTKRHFDDIIDIFSISKAFPESFRKDTSLHYSKQSILHKMSPEARYLDMIMRGDHANLQDMAFGLHYSPDKAKTFVVIHGCTPQVFGELDSWLNAMKHCARHPLLMVNLFFELHHRRAQERYRYLRCQTLDLSFEVDGLNEPEVPMSVIEHQKEMVDKVNILGDQIGVVGNELIALHLRFADVKSLFDDVAEEPSHDRKQCMIQDGVLLKDSLTQLDQRNESLQAKVANVRANNELLLPSIFNVIALNDSQINKSLAAAARRDSSVMVGITVGTLTFFPGTTMATIFALPFFNWNAGPGENVTDHRFGIYLAVVIPLTAVTLLILAVWLSLADKASREFISVRNYVGRLSIKSFVQNERRRIAAKFNRTQGEVEKADSMLSLPAP